MPHIKRILFPTDLSPQCQCVTSHVKAMAERFQAELVILNALESPPGYYKDWHAFLTLVNWEAIQGNRQRELAAFIAEQALTGPSVTSVMEEGDPAHVIVSYAREHAIDLIMMPTHGYGPFRSLLIGSVAAKVLHDVEIPVWTGVHVAERPASAATACERILCAVDLNEKSVPVIRWAAQFASELKATVHLAHAIPGMSTVDESFQSFLFSTARKELAKLQELAGTAFEDSVMGGEVGAVVREAAVNQKADLVVIGRGHASEALGRLRTEAYAVIRQSPCPVISV